MDHDDYRLIRTRIVKTSLDSSLIQEYSAVKRLSCFATAKLVKQLDMAISSSGDRIELHSAAEQRASQQISDIQTSTFWSGAHRRAVRITVALTGKVSEAVGFLFLDRC